MLLDGRITEFWFYKNWVPTLFPIHLGMSFLTFTGYTLFGGPTSATIVRFTVHFELRSAGSGEVITALRRELPFDPGARGVVWLRAGSLGE